MVSDGALHILQLNSIYTLRVQNLHEIQLKISNTNIQLFNVMMSCIWLKHKHYQVNNVKYFYAINPEEKNIYHIQIIIKFPWSYDKSYDIFRVSTTWFTENFFLEIIFRQKTF